MLSEHTGHSLANAPTARTFLIFFGTECLSGTLGNGTSSVPRGMPWAIYRLIAAGHFGPDEIAAMTKAYEAALTEIHLLDRHNPLTELIARSIVIVTGTGERNPEIIKGRALAALGISKAAA